MKRDRLLLRPKIWHHRDNKAMLSAGRAHGIQMQDQIYWGGEYGRVSTVEPMTNIATFDKLPITTVNFCLYYIHQCPSCKLFGPKDYDGYCVCDWLPGERGDI